MRFLLYFGVMVNGCITEKFCLSDDFGKYFPSALAKRETSDGMEHLKHNSTIKKFWDVIRRVSDFPDVSFYN